MTESEFQWHERPALSHPGPNGKTWVVRQMFSYQTVLDRFVPHLLAMGEGLERAYFTEWGDVNDQDDAGVFVIGLRDTSDEDAAAAKARAEMVEAKERQLLADLLEKYGPE